MDPLNRANAMPSTVRPWAVCVFTLACAVAPSLAIAQAVASPPSAEAAAANDLAKFGGQAGLAALMDDFVARLRADPRTAAFFKDTEPRHLASQLTAQLCQLLGGACVYEGPTMRDVHDGLGIARRDFNALVELLQDAMSARNISFAAQNRLLAHLAPMYRDIVTPR